MLWGENSICRFMVVLLTSNSAFISDISAALYPTLAVKLSLNFFLCIGGAAFAVPAVSAPYFPVLAGTTNDLFLYDPLEILMECHGAQSAQPQRAQGF